MALTINQIYNIQNSVVRPESMLLLDMVTIMSIKHAQYFLDTRKVTPPNTPADSYKTKVESLAKRAKEKDGSALLNILDALIINVANFLNYSDVKAYDDANWQTMVENNIPIAFEKVADTTAAEKSAYEGL